jgi:hypothetical protein
MQRNFNYVKLLGKLYPPFLSIVLEISPKYLQNSNFELRDCDVLLANES